MLRLSDKVRAEIVNRYVDEPLTSSEMLAKDFKTSRVTICRILKAAGVERNKQGNHSLRGDTTTYQRRMSKRMAQIKATLLRKQQGKCSICILPFKSDKDTHVDHDHTTLKIRGLLCGGCNVGLGYFQDSSDVLKRAAAYLEQHST